MIIFKSATDVNAFQINEQFRDKSIGFVPTMGALHQGHLSLIELSKQTNDLAVCSIFVNPTQFNNPEDFKHYPVTIEKDIEQLIVAGCDILFLPSVKEMYPSSHQKKNYDLGLVEQVLEGAHRPGHFQGVCEVVERLLDIVRPHHLYLGQKDFQQCLVIARLFHLLGLENKIALHIAPTLRESDGLAMSSRNLRLTPMERQKAVTIFECLMLIKENYRRRSAVSLIDEATRLLTEQGFKIDYIAVCERTTLQPVENQSVPAVALIAASIGSVRLIDNMQLD